jgi:hypothetical protein
MFRQPWPKGEMVRIGKSTPKDRDGVRNSFWQGPSRQGMNYKYIKIRVGVKV